MYRVYYSGGGVYDSREGGYPPGWGALVVVQDHPERGKDLVTGTDYMVLVDGRWVGLDLAGLLDHVVNVLHVALVGRMVSDEEYREIFRQAKLEEEKTGWGPFERKP